jgi:transposase/arginine repressor
MFNEKVVEIAQNLREKFNLSIRQISSFLQVSKSTIHRWISSNVIFSSKPEQSRGRPIIPINLSTFFPKFQFHSLDKMINENGLLCSKSTLSRRFQTLGIKKKRVYHCTKNDTVNLNQSRQKFSFEMKNEIPSDYISIDESSFYFRLNHTSGWSTTNNRIHLPMQRTQSKRYTILSAVGYDGLISQQVILGSVNGQLFKDFILNLPRNKIILLDNAPFHKTKEFMKIVNENDIKLKFTSPYSPEWNPVEFYFSYLKNRYRSIQSSKSNHFTIFNDIRVASESVPSTFFPRLFENVFLNIKRNVHR